MNNDRELSGKLRGALISPALVTLSTLLGTGVVEQQAKLLLGHPISSAGGPGFKSQLCLCSSSLLIHMLEDSRSWLKYVSHCHPHGSPKLGPSLPASARPSPNSGRNLGSESTDGRYLSFFLSPSPCLHHPAFQINKNIFKNLIQVKMLMISLFSYSSFILSSYIENKPK